MVKGASEGLHGSGMAPRIRKNPPPNVPVEGGAMVLVEPMTGIEPAPPAWEAGVLPLNYIGMEEIGVEIDHLFRQ